MDKIVDEIEINIIYSITILFKQTMRPNSYHPFVFLFLCITVVLSVRQVEDFTYSQYTIIQGEQQKIQIRLSPQRSILERYEFPNTWEITEFLSQSLQKEKPLPQIANIGQEISKIKQQTSEFLKLSNKADLLVRNIQQLPPMKNDLTLVVREEQLAVIQTHQGKLKGLNDQIDQKGVQLQKIVRQLMIQQQNPLFKEAALNFEKKALAQKIHLLNQLMSQAKSQKSSEERKENEQKLQNYFSKLNDIFRTESGLIDAIDTLLKNHNELTILKARVTSLTSQLKAHQLTLTQKEQCHNEFQSIKEKQRHDREVIKLIQTLKQKKLQFNEPNKYCEGVVNKLIERVKKLLIGYDYVYECAHELQHTRQNRDKVKKELQEAQKKLDQLQLTRGVEEFRKKFENNRAVIANKVNQLKTLQLDQFYRYPSLISIAITESEQRIKQIEQTIANLPVKSTYDIVSTQNLIKQKVNEIKTLKAQYCKQNELYNQNSEIIQNRIAKLQQQQEYNHWIRNVQIEKLQELQVIKKQMKAIESTILSYLL